MFARLSSGLAGLVAGLLLATTAMAQVGIGFGGVPYDPDQPIEVTSDALTIDQATGEAVFTGNVIVYQGDLRLAADRVTVLYSELEGRRQVDEVLATGGVLVTRGADAAEGQTARFDVATDLLTMTGSVLVTQGATAVAGDRMVVNMLTGNGTVEGRVRTVLDTGEDE